MDHSNRREKVWNFISNPKVLIPITSGLILLFVFLPYYLKFGGNGLSDNTTKWGEYGDYLSGVSSFVNLVLLIIITLYVSRIDDKNNNKQLASQRKIFLAQFRQSELLKWKEKFNRFDDVNFQDLRVYKKSLADLNNNLETCFDQMKILFPAILNKDNVNLKDNIVQKIDNQLDLMGDYNNLYLLNKIQMTRLEELHENLSESKDLLFNKLQLEIINDLDVNSEAKKSE